MDDLGREILTELRRIADSLERLPSFSRGRVSRETVEGDSAGEGGSREGEPPIPAADWIQEKTTFKTAVLGTPLERARGVWPRLVEAARVHGATWKPDPGKRQLEIVVERIKEGATDEEIVRAVDGHMKRLDFREDGGTAHLTATTIYRPSNFDANVEAGWPEIEKTEPEDLRRQETLDFLSEFGKGEDDG
jgi:hypothetical protein